MNSVDDVLDLSESNDDDCVAVSVTMQENKSSNNDQIRLDRISKENPLIAEFINNCLILDKTDGMKRVIYGSLLDIYAKADKTFIKSNDFRNSLTTAISRIKHDPNHRYTHIKHLHEVLKYSRIRRRVQLKTLSQYSKATTTAIIDLDEYPDEIAISGEKENNTSFNCSQSSTNEKEESNIENEMLNIQNSNREKILELELEIAEYKKILAKLDEKEVYLDSVNSPYLQGEKIKEKIVSLYKKLCQLTGTELVRKPKISLSVIEGHPPGPVRRLEKMLNDNIGSDGHPPFPNFRDVVMCVVKANEIDALGWTQHQVMMEATVLFTHCGRALQKRRQRREWHDLLSKVNREHCDEDPADSDPELLARLEANKRIAQKKELEVLERFTMMQNGRPLGADTEMQVLDSESDTDISSDDTSSFNQEPKPNLSPGTTNHNEYDSHMSSFNQKPKPDLSTDTTIHNKYDSHIDIKEEPMHIDNIESPNNNVVKIKKEHLSNIIDKLEELSGDYKTVVEIEDTFVTIDISDTSDEEFD